MIKDVRDTELYFNNGKELIEWLNIDPEIAADIIPSLENCETDKDYVDFANEYILRENDGVMPHEFKII